MRDVEGRAAQCVSSMHEHTGCTGSSPHLTHGCDSVSHTPMCVCVVVYVFICMCAMVECVCNGGVCVCDDGVCVCV